MAPQRIAFIVSALLFFPGGQSMAVERAVHSIELSEPPYEIRDYAPTLVAVVHVDGRRSESVSAGFRILARYIFGGNRTNGKIAMTAPVLQTRSPDVAMARPVEPPNPESARSGWDVRFTMPAAYTMSSLPVPSDARVRIVEMPRRRIASITFSGLWTDANLKSHEALLREWLTSRKLIPTVAATYAYYDPPWTPWFLRTNEVLIDIAPSSP